MATKFGIVRDPNDPSKRGVRSDRAYVRECVERSLKNLNMDYIDLFYIHRFDKKIPVEETVDEMSKLIKEGKIRHIALNETHIDNIERAHKVHPITAVQAEYSLYTRFAEKAILPLCQKLGIGFVAYSPLGRGLLTGAIDRVEDLPKDDARYSLPRITGENWQHNKIIAEKNKEVASNLHAKPSQIALAWLLSKYDHLVPIPGTKTQSYLQENVLAEKLTLSPEVIKTLDDAIPEDGVKGLRYPQSSMDAFDLTE